MSRPRPLVASVTLWAMAQSRLAASRRERGPRSELRSLLAVVAERSDDDGCCTGAETLGRDLGWDAKTVRRWLGKARQQGLIDVTVRSGRGRPNVIHFLSPIVDAPDLVDLARFDADLRKDGQALVQVSERGETNKQGQAAVQVSPETWTADTETGTTEAAKLDNRDPKQGQAAVHHTSGTSGTSEDTSALASLAPSLDPSDTDNGNGNGAQKERPPELTRLEGIRLALSPPVRPRRPMTDEEYADRRALLRAQAESLGVAR